MAGMSEGECCACVFITGLVMFGQGKQADEGKESQHQASSEGESRSGRHARTGGRASQEGGWCRRARKSPPKKAKKKEKAHVKVTRVASPPDDESKTESRLDTLVRQEGKKDCKPSSPEGSVPAESPRSARSSKTRAHRPLWKLYRPRVAALPLQPTGLRPRNSARGWKI